MCVLFDGGCTRAIQRHRAVTIHAYLIGWLAQLRVVVRSVYVVTAKACDAATVHYALHEIISLHPVLVCRGIREMRERQLA